MLTPENFKEHWEKKFPDIILTQTHFLLAVSGGLDSVGLTYIMHLLGAKCTIAHVNFQLRAAESIRDEQFVSDFANRLQIPLKVNRFDTAAYAQTYKMGIQQAAREIRYAWFAQLIQEIKSNESGTPKTNKVVLLTAHHADDQVETVLMQLFRGTGLHGLTGIPETRNDTIQICRPLLGYTKKQIEGFAKEYSLTYVEDSSNEKNDYTRNLIRNKLIPSIQEVYEHVTENILDTVARLKEAEGIVNATVSTFWKKGLRSRHGIETISIPHWKKVKENQTYTWGFIQSYGFKPSQILEVHKLLDAQNGAYIASSTHRFIKYNETIQIVSNISDLEHLMVYVGEGDLQTKNGLLHFETIEASKMGEIKKESHYAYLDADQLDWPLLYRTWQASDYFYPLGLRKKKKLNHFLGSLKLSPVVKQRAGVITMGDKLLWVVGQRIDDRFKITPQTKTVLLITLLDRF
ncbi:MAG: tRNA lysidine(34) synthetase TilS [Bacteroidetes bacterium]|nr:tRNA lysidine(34) synthetase TilS [Bacteroidota bacterium]